MRIAAAALLGLALAGFSLGHSKRHQMPVFDEVHYLEQARGLAVTGLRCYWTLECREDNRHPLYAALLAPLMTGDPEDFARAKLLTLATALAALAAVYWSGAGLFGVAVLALSGSFAVQSQRVLADILFAALYCGALALLARGKWAAFGAVAGLGYLCKGSAHFLLLGAAAVALAERKKKEPLLALGAFCLAAFPLLRRNVLLWGDPFHNVNAKLVWFDSWAGGLKLGPDVAGPGWYFARHSLGEAAWRFAAGAAKVGGQLLQTIGAGPEGLTRLTGAAILILAVMELRRRKRAEVLAVAVPGAALFCALAWGAQAGVTGPRLILPVALSLLPYAAARVKLEPRWYALAACAGLILGRGGWTAKPLELWGVPPDWARASAYVQKKVDAAGFLLPFDSVYSSWDCCRDRRHPYPFDSARDIEIIMKQRGIKHVLLDTGVADDPGLKLEKCLEAGRFVFLAEDC